MISASLLFGTMLSGTYLTASDRTSAPSIGDAAPAWEFVQGADGKLHSLSDYNNAQVVVVAFLCNKCPCVRGYEGRFKQLVDSYGGKVRFVGVNSSIGELENLNEMQQRVASGNLNFDYLRDANQTVGRSFGATSTPHVFVLDQNRRIAYTGAFDDNRDPRQVKHHYVLDAVNALLKGQEVAIKRTQQFGCTITYQ
jgi:peroxiredoxin